MAHTTPSNCMLKVWGLIYFYSAHFDVHSAADKIHGQSWTMGPVYGAVSTSHYGLFSGSDMWTKNFAPMLNTYVYPEAMSGMRYGEACLRTIEHALQYLDKRELLIKAPRLGNFYFKARKICTFNWQLIFPAIGLYDVYMLPSSLIFSHRLMWIIKITWLSYTTPRKMDLIQPMSVVSCHQCRTSSHTILVKPCEMVWTLPEARDLTLELLHHSKKFVLDLCSFIQQDYDFWKHKGCTKKGAW